jgi:hypothetical protein
VTQLTLDLSVTLARLCDEHEAGEPCPHPERRPCCREVVWEQDGKPLPVPFGVIPL